MISVLYQAAVIPILSGNTQDKAIPREIFTDAQGNVLGTHKGIIHCTVGQHRKLRISLPKAMHVCRICAEQNTVVLVEERELYAKEAEISNVHRISGIIPKAPLRCKAKVRYRQQEQWTTAVPLASGNIRLEFDALRRGDTVIRIP